MADGSWTTDGAESLPGASILLVEDDHDIREFMATLLRHAGFEPTVCGSAEAGLEQLREQRFDLVLTDYSLPRRSGGWLLEQAGAEGLLEATPALVVTAHPNPPDLEHYEVIPKPCDPDDFISRVTESLDGTARLPASSRRPARNSPGREGSGGDGGARGTAPTAQAAALSLSS